MIDDCRDENEKPTTSDERRSRNNEIIAENLIAIDGVYQGSHEGYETFDYEIKLIGENVLLNGKGVDCEIKRVATNSVLSTTTYALYNNTARLKTDDTAFVFTDKARLILGEYGNTDLLAPNSSAHGLNTVVNNLDKSILNCTTAGKDMKISAVSVDEG